MGSLFSKPKTPKVPKVDIEGDIKKYVSGYQKSLPDVISSEQEYRPQFLGLNLGDVSTFLQGTDDQMGLFGLGRLSQQETAQNLAAARQADLSSMMGMAPQFRGFAQALSPESQAQVDASAAEAARASQAARQLTPQEQRMADQAAREAYASRGRLMGNEAVSSEILNREGIMAQKRAEAAQARNAAFGQAQEFYTRPGLMALGSAPVSYQAGQQQLGLGLGAIGSATPQMINPDVGVNLGMTQRAQQTQANIAGAQAQANWASGMFNAISNIGGSATAAAMSDVRLKTDITPTGDATQNGVPIYTYRYIGDKQKYRGVMAQDVQRIQPDAVVQTESGYLAVDYNKI
jgi:hypothetical protein